jgi:DNA mismatch endonuclease (patch repair protein)
LRFRKDLRIQTEEMAVKADVVFTRSRLAVFVDGCFWHRCPEHASDPKRNAAYWGPKLEGNVRRDRRVDAALRRDGWSVLRIWEHEAPAEAAERIAQRLAASKRSHW